MSRIERLFFRYNMELFTLGFAFFIALVLFMFDSRYDLEYKLWNLTICTILLTIMICCAKSNRLPEKKSIYINLLWIHIFSLFAFSLINSIIIDGTTNSEKKHITSVMQVNDY